MNFNVLLETHEHLRGPEHLRPHILVNLVILLINYIHAHPEVNKHCLSVVIDANILRLDVSVNNFGDFMTVVQCL